MSINAEIARQFEEMAAVMELSGAVVYKVLAYQNAARTIRDLAIDLATLQNDKKAIMKFDGIGESTAKKIIEFCQTGRIIEHDEMVSKVPPGVLEMTRLQGVGPKTAKLLWEKAGIIDLAGLKREIEAPGFGKLAGVPTLGEKKIQNMAQALAFADSTGERTRLGEALPLAESLIEMLKQTNGAGVQRMEYAGSLRRGAETIGDIDILACAKKPEILTKAFTSLPMVQQVLATGARTSVRLNRGIQVDLRMIEEGAFGASLLYFTGSKRHNIALRERALKKGWTLNEYGLFPDDDDELPPQKRGIKPIAARTEEEIYKKLGLPWIPPELREDRGEFNPPTSDGKLPDLITLEDIKAELHAHTIASDGALTIEQLALEAKERGFHTIAVTDHSQSSALANGLKPDRLLRHIDAVREAAAKIKGITILAGSEVDIHADGRLDYEDELLAKLDIVVASPHAALRQSPKEATARLLAAIRHPLVHIIGHPTGRYINKREGIVPDLPTLIEAAVKHNTALEINSNHARLDLRDTHVRAAVEGEALIAINTDAHSVDDFDELRFGVLTARRGWLTAKQCINAWSKAKLHKWLKSKR